MTSNQHGPYAWGYKHDTMVGTMSSEPARGSQSPKPISVQIEVCNPTS